MSDTRKTVEDFYYDALDADTVTLNTSPSKTGKLLGWDGLGVIIDVSSAISVVPMTSFTTMTFTRAGKTYTLPSLS